MIFTIEEIKKRVLYTLDKVKMLRYKNRPVSMLSGGERQRVGIARALVKNPKIIIADEPTGNLDSKNSLEVMNIIKSISTKYLVVLVTHEVELAKFYADRIIELKDGIIVNDYENKSVGTLNYKIENRIYLKDFKDVATIKKDNISFSVYRDHNEDVNINVVFKNGNIYIETNGPEKLEIVDSGSNIELIDDYYKEIKDIKIDEDTFDIEKIQNNNLLFKYSSIFRLGSFIKYGFKKVFSYPILKKILLGGFFLSGMFIYYATSSIFSTINIKDENFITVNRNYITASVKNIDVNEYLELENNIDIDYILPTNSIIYLRIKYDKYLQTQNYSGFISGSLSDINMIKSNELIMGRMPTKTNEIVIDKMVLEKFIDNNYAYTSGFSNIEDLLNHEVYMEFIEDLVIVGITDTKEPNIYTNKSLFINLISNSMDDLYYYEDVDTSNMIVDYSLANNKYIELTKGKLPQNDYEVIINEMFQNEYALNKEIDKKVNGKKLKVVGYYKNINGYDSYSYFVNNNTIKYDLIVKSNTLSVYSYDKENTLNYLYDNKINAKDSYEYSKNEYISEQSESIINTLIISGVILGISLIEILLMIRSSFLSRIKEVGIYRAIGIKKSDIYKMFSGEIFAITSIASFTGISFMTYILYNLSKIPYLENMFMVNPFTYLFSIVLVLIFNLIVGLIPVYNTIRKTPAQILSRFDVD